MPRKAQVDPDCMSEFARWLLGRMSQRATTLSAVAEHTRINVSYLHKVLKSYLPQYQQYKRLSFKRTVQVGEYLGDVGGALRAADYTETYQAATAGDLTLRPKVRRGREAGTSSGTSQASSNSGSVEPSTIKASSNSTSNTADTFSGSDLAEGGFPETAEEWPPELLEAMHYSRTLDPETQRYIYGLWREQARVYAAVSQSEGKKKTGTGARARLHGEQVLPPAKAGAEGTTECE